MPSASPRLVLPAAEIDCVAQRQLMTIADRYSRVGLGLRLYASHEYCSSYSIKGKRKQIYNYSAFIEVPYTAGAQVRITQCYLQRLPLPRKHSPDGASQTEVADIKDERLSWPGWLVT